MQYADADEHPVQTNEISYSGVSSFGQGGHLPFFSKKIRFLEPDDEIWLYPCHNKDDWVSKEIRRIFGFNDVV